MINGMHIRFGRHSDSHRNKNYCNVFELLLFFQVKSSPRHGFGVFATSKISCGEKVCFYDGELKDARVRVAMIKLPDGHLKIKNASGTN